jgi:hypothetical protein
VRRDADVYKDVEGGEDHAADTGNHDRRDRQQTETGEHGDLAELRLEALAELPAGDRAREKWVPAGLNAAGEHHPVGRVLGELADAELRACGLSDRATPQVRRVRAVEDAFAGAVEHLDRFAQLPALLVGAFVHG